MQAFASIVQCGDDGGKGGNGAVSNSLVQYPTCFILTSAIATVVIVCEGG